MILLDTNPIHWRKRLWVESGLSTFFTPSCHCIRSDWQKKWFVTDSPKFHSAESDCQYNRESSKISFKCVPEINHHDQNHIRDIWLGLWCAALAWDYEVLSSNPATLQTFFKRTCCSKKLLFSVSALRKILEEKCNLIYLYYFNKLDMSKKNFIITDTALIEKQAN